LKHSYILIFAYHSIKIVMLKHPTYKTKQIGLNCTNCSFKLVTYWWWHYSYIFISFIFEL